MDRQYWQQQSLDKPLFPNLLWNKPENRQLAGKLLIVGGNSYSFNVVNEAFALSQQAGIGVARVVLPEALRATLGPVLEAGEFISSTRSGSFAHQALGELLSLSQWADGVLVAGDLGRNSETALLFEKYILHYIGPLVLTRDAVNYFVTTPLPLLQRPETTLALSFSQLQRLAVGLKWPNPLIFSMDLLRMVDTFHQLSTTYKCNFITLHQGHLCVAVQGEILTMRLEPLPATWRLKAAVFSAVWLIQNTKKPLEAIATALFEAYSAGTNNIE